jgi:hypothetical protein
MRPGTPAPSRVRGPIRRSTITKATDLPYNYEGDEVTEPAAFGLSGADRGGPMVR